MYVDPVHDEHGGMGGHEDFIDTGHDEHGND